MPEQPISNPTPTPPLALTWAGVLPFAVLTAVALLPAPPDWLRLLLIGYAVLILAFMAGALWMQALQESPLNHQRLLISNALVLAAWPALLLPMTWASLWLALLFAAHLVMERPWQVKAWPSWYRRLRVQASLTVVLLLSLAAGLRLALYH